MISWGSKKLLNTSLVVALFATFVTVGFLNTPVSADAITGKSNNGLANTTERWMRLRAVTRCFSINDVGKNSYSDVKNAAIFDSGDTVIGYLNEDGKVDCDGDKGEAFVKNTFTTIGYSDSIEAFCSVQPMAIRGSSDTNKESDFDNCVNGAGDEFDMDNDSGGFNQTSQQVKQFKDGYAKHADNPVAWSPTGEMMYYMYLQSLITFCGAERVGAYDESEKNNVDADPRLLVVNDVDLATGEIIPSVYSLSRDQTDKVDDIYTDADQNMISNVTCTKMSQKTHEYDDAMAAYVKSYNLANKDDVGTGTIDDGGGEEGSSEAVCTAGALGWVFCPLVDFMSTATQEVANYLEEHLVFERLISLDPNDPAVQGDAIRAVWGSVLAIANAGLIIAFLIIIFSQATSVGLSSYGIKKLLPKVAAAAVLMNLSFYICAVAVDLSNILGVSIQAIVQEGIDQLAPIAGADTKADASTGQWVATTTFLLGAVGVGALTGSIFLLLPILMQALLAVLVALLVIAARNVLITLLIIVSPLAFLAWILPNTEDWFTKWRKAFTAMLLMFPVVMAIFYGSVLVSNMILITGDGGGDNEVGFMTNIIALVVLTVPLFSLPFIMKAAGSVLDRWGAVVNNRNKGLIDRTRKVGKERYDRGDFARGHAIRKQAKAEYRNKKFASNLSAAEKARTLNDAYENKAKELGYVTASGNGDVSRLSASDKATAAAQWSSARKTRRTAGGIAGVRSDLVANARRGDNRLTGAMLGNSQDQRLVASPIVQAQASMLERTAQAQAAKAYKERESAIITSYEQAGAAGADVSAGGYLEQQYAQAVQTGNQEQATAAITRMAGMGAGGRHRAATVLKKYDVGSKQMQDAITKSVMQDNFSGLVGSRADTVKGSGFKPDASGKTTWNSSGALGNVGTGQLATQDEKSLFQNFSDISQTEAATIMNDDNLRSSIQNAKSRAILSMRATGATSLPTTGLIDPSDPALGTWDKLGEE